jgi:hypothetical protein
MEPSLEQRVPSERSAELSFITTLAGSLVIPAILLVDNERSCHPTQQIGSSRLASCWASTIMICDNDLE